MELTEDQKHLVEDLSGSAFVSACPGAGKTRAVVARYLRRTEQEPRKGIALVSFTNAAIDEVRRRCGDQEPTKAPHFVGRVFPLRLRLDLDVTRLDGPHDWPARSSQEVISVPHGEWGAALDSIDSGAFVDVLVPVTEIEGRQTAARRIREAKVAIREGRFEEAVGKARSALDAVRDACDTLKISAEASKKKPPARDQAERWAVLI